MTVADVSHRPQRAPCSGSMGAGALNDGPGARKQLAEALGRVGGLRPRSEDQWN